MKSLRILLTIFLLAPLPVFAQTVHIPDPNLRAAISEELDGAPVTRETMLQLTELDARERGVIDLTGLGYAHNLKSLTLVYNNISDLTPISDLRLDDLWLWDNLVADLSPLANMRSLTHLDLGYNRISDISPLEKLTRLKWLELSGNQITDITTLSNLTQLTLLEAFKNNITDVTPLAGLTRLEHLKIQRNLIFDHSPLDGLHLTVFEYDEFCDMPPLPLQDRFDNRSFPSLVSPWGIVPIDQPHLSDRQQLAQHDLYFCCMGMFYMKVVDANDGWKVYGNVRSALELRAQFLADNPNMIFITTVEAVVEDFGTFPPDSDYWLRDETGDILEVYGVGLVNLNHPYVQQKIIDQVVAVSKCGLYDGVHFDFWHEGANDYRGQMPGVLAILKGIREQVRDDFLILANTNIWKAPVSAPYINGLFLESGFPSRRGGSPEEIEKSLFELESTLTWAETHLLEPQINALLGFGYGNEPMDSPTNQRWMRVITTLHLTFSDSYVMYYLSGPDGGTDTGLFSGFYWYDFWDADLGRPLGEKSQLYEGRPGLYIREYTNGWAVYNHSGEAQVVTLPAEVRSVTSGLSNTKHAVLNLDGDILLNIPPLLPGDVNGDGIVNILDLTLVAQGFGTGDLTVDVNGDGVVNVFDLVFVAGEF